MSKQGTKFSVIIPSYNDAENVKTIISELQKKSVDEIIVVESGETDYFSQIKGKIKLIRGKKGRAQQMNEGARYANGQYLIFLHADSDIKKLKFNKINAPWGGWKLQFCSERKYFRIIEFTSNLRAKRGIIFGDQGLYVEQKLFKKIRGFPERGYEDIDISRKLKKHAKPKILSERIITSPRRFLRKGIIKTHLTMGLITALYLLGIKSIAKKLYKIIK